MNELSGRTNYPHNRPWISITKLLVYVEVAEQATLPLEEKMRWLAQSLVSAGVEISTLMFENEKVQLEEYKFSGFRTCKASTEISNLNLWAQHNCLIGSEQLNVYSGPKQHMFLIRQMVIFYDMMGSYPKVPTTAGQPK